MAKNVTELVLVGVSPETARAISTALEGTASIVASVPDLGRYAEIPSEGGGQALLIGIDDSPEMGFEAVRHLSSVRPSRPVIVLSESQDSDQVLKAMRAGARDYAVLEGDFAQVVASVRNLAAERDGAGSGKIVCVFPAKGGSGATTLATNLAGTARARRDLRVVLVDLNLQMGDCLLFLDLESRYTIADAIRSMNRLDSELLRGLLAVHASSGVHVLAQSGRVEDADEVTPERTGALLQFLKRQYDLVVVDGLRSFDDLAIAALDASDEVLLVLTQDIPSIKNARRCLELFKRLDYPDRRIHVVLNRFVKGHELDGPTVAESLGRPVEARVANDFPTIMAGVNRGVLLCDAAARARVAEDIAEVLGVALGKSEEAPRKGVQSVLGGLFWRRKVRDAAG